MKLRKITPYQGRSLIIAQYPRIRPPLEQRAGTPNPVSQTAGLIVRARSPERQPVAVMARPHV